MRNAAGALAGGDVIVEPAITLPYRSGRPIRVGAISNPASGRNQKKGTLEAVRRVLAAYPGTSSLESDHPAGIVAAAQELAGNGVEMILVNGGDGTVQAVMTGLFRMTSSGRMPLLVLLPGGTTNMIARDVRSGYSAARSLDELLTGARAGKLEGTLVTRAVIRCEFGAPEGPLFGMFFGAGAVYHGIQFCRRYLYAVGLKGELGPGFALMVLLAKLMLGQGEKVLPPVRAHGWIDREPLEPQEYFGLLVSTLDRLFLGLYPFWGGGRGPLRYTSVAYHCRHKVRAAPAIMRGRPNRIVRPEFGYESRKAVDIELHLDSGFTMDGELFDPPADRPVLLHGGQNAFFLRAPNG